MFYVRSKLRKNDFSLLLMMLLLLLLSSQRLKTQKKTSRLFLFVAAVADDDANVKSVKSSACVNIINVFFASFLYERRFGSFFLVTYWQKSTFVQKNAQKHIDEIVILSQFHQHFTSAFFILKQIEQLFSNYVYFWHQKIGKKSCP